MIAPLTGSAQCGLSVVVSLTRSSVSLSDPLSGCSGRTRPVIPAFNQVVVQSVKDRAQAAGLGHMKVSKVLEPVDLRYPVPFSQLDRAGHGYTAATHDRR